MAIADGLQAYHQALAHVVLYSAHIVFMPIVFMPIYGVHAYQALAHVQQRTAVALESLRSLNEQLTNGLIASRTL